MCRTRATETLCPWGVHPYPEFRWRRIVPVGKGYYCRGCKSDYDVNGAYAVDDVAVARAIAGDPPPYLHPEERRRVVLALASRFDKPTIREIARRARCHPRTVQRIQEAGRGDKW